jgi:hypothetical protein
VLVHVVLFAVVESTAKLPRNCMPKIRMRFCESHAYSAAARALAAPRFCVDQGSVGFGIESHQTCMTLAVPVATRAKQLPTLPTLLPPLPHFLLMLLLLPPLTLGRWERGRDRMLFKIYIYIYTLTNIPCA